MNAATDVELIYVTRFVLLVSTSSGVSPSQQVPPPTCPPPRLYKARSWTVQEVRGADSRGQGGPGGESRPSEARLGLAMSVVRCSRINGLLNDPSIEISILLRLDYAHGPAPREATAVLAVSLLARRPPMLHDVLWICFFPPLQTNAALRTVSHVTTVWKSGSSPLSSVRSSEAADDRIASQLHRGVRKSDQQAWPLTVASVTQ